MKIRPMGFQDTPDSAHMAPRPPEPKLGGEGGAEQKFSEFGYLGSGGLGTICAG